MTTFAPARRAVLPLMAATLAAYIMAHASALRAIGGGLGLRDRCYFRCGAGAATDGSLAAVGAALFLLVAASSAGAVVGRRVSLRAYERPLVTTLVAFVLVAVPSAALGGLAWVAGAATLRPPVGPLLAVVPALLVICAARVRGVRPGSVSRERMAFGGLALPLAVVAAMLFTTLVVITLSHPPTGYDALSYHAPMAVYFWRDGNIGELLDRSPWAWALAHPGAAELLFGLLRVAGGERVASLGQLPFALLGACAAYAFARRTGLPSGPSRLGALAFLLAPIVVLQSGIQVNDLAAGALLMTAAALASAPGAEWGTSRVVAVLLAVALAVTTKLAALPAGAVIGVYACAVALRARRGRALAAALLLGAVVVAPWWLRNAAMFGNPIYPAALPFVGRGYVTGAFVKKDTWFVPGTWAWPLYPVVEPHSEMSGFGALFATAALAGLLIAALWRRRAAPLRLYGIVAAVSLPV